MKADISICIVIYKPDQDVLMTTLNSLATALETFSDSEQFKLYIVDNSPTLSFTADNHPIFSTIPSEIISGHGNVGFGRANNMVLNRSIGKYHLVLNPDVELSPSALWEAFSFMQHHETCGLLTPAARYPDGRRQFLCKQYPNLLDLFVRGFAPKSIQSLLTKRLERYEMRKYTEQQIYWHPPIVSGCFMYFRSDVFQKLKGFDPRYLLYFEDFDISLRTAQIADIAYVPSVQIIHRGGNAAAKGWWHVGQFLRSALIFFSSHKVKLF